jgi:hypothetical protein
MYRENVKNYNVKSVPTIPPHPYSSLNILWVIKARRIGWSGHVAFTGKRSGAYRVLMGFVLFVTIRIPTIMPVFNSNVNKMIGYNYTTLCRCT